MAATVKYQIATYSGEIEVSCEPDEDNDVIIAGQKEFLKERPESSLSATKAGKLLIGTNLTPVE